MTDAVERAITKALAKTPADRFPTASQFSEALTAVEAAPRPRRNLMAYAAIAILVIIGVYTLISRNFGPSESATVADHFRKRNDSDCNNSFAAVALVSAKDLFSVYEQRLKAVAEVNFSKVPSGRTPCCAPTIGTYYGQCELFCGASAT